MIGELLPLRLYGIYVRWFLELYIEVPTAYGRERRRQSGATTNR